MMIPQWIIEKKRDGGELAENEIRAFITGYTEGTIPDYQMSALAMAICCRGMTPAEISFLTDAMMHSGDCLDFASCPRPTADKHSTGGIGDKLSLMIAPLAAAAGLAVPMISGRGLGITGGTLDKLESIPGYQTRLSLDQFRKIVETVGCSIIGQTDRLAPADRKLYALRDVTGTVPSVPLITASILSKKLAEGAGTLVFDVKCGSGAFMQTPVKAQELAQSLTRVARDMGRRVSTLVTDMNAPLGHTVGNAVEVAEAIETLRGEGPADLRRLTLALTTEMVVTAGLSPDRTATYRDLERRLDKGEALEIFRKMVIAHGGDVRSVDAPDRLPQPGAVEVISAADSGYVKAVDACAIGRIVLELGGGRTRTDAAIDCAAGIDGLVQIGEKVEKGQPLMRLLAKDAATMVPWRDAARQAVTLADSQPEPRRLID